METERLVTAARQKLDRAGGEPVFALGNGALLDRGVAALYCSVRCPGSIILRTYDLAVSLRAAGIAVAGGFHSPMERECLAVLLRGEQPLIICPARGIAGRRVPVAYREPLAKGRLLLLSPFGPAEKRVTAATAVARNRFVAALADVVIVAHAEPASKLAALCREVAASGKPLFTLADPANDHLRDLGARPLPPVELAATIARLLVV